MTASLETPAPSATKGRYLGWLLFVALVFAVAVAISLAVQLTSEADDLPSRCDPAAEGLFDDGCCIKVDRRVGDGLFDDECCIEADRPDGEGLFDAEEHFADNRRALPYCQ